MRGVYSGTVKVHCLCTRSLLPVPLPPWLPADRASAEASAKSSRSLSSGSTRALVPSLMPCRPGGGEGRGQECHAALVDTIATAMRHSVIGRMLLAQVLRQWEGGMGSKSETPIDEDNDDHHDLIMMIP